VAYFSGIFRSIAPVGKFFPQIPVLMINSKMKILVAIASYGTRNDRYLAELISRYRAMPYSFDIVVLSNIAKEVAPGVEVRVGLPQKNPWTLPFGHKKLFAERLEDYDLFIYSEDDTPLSEQNIEAFLRVTAILPEGQIAGFLRSETGPDGRQYFCDMFGPFHWELNSVERRGDHAFAFYTNEHSACYVLTQEQLRRAIASGGFLVEPHEEKYDLLVTAATDPYTQCKMRKMVCVSHLQDFIVPHLPNKYLRIFGVESQDLHNQIQTLLAIKESGVKIRPLLPTETKLKGMGFSKNLYEPARDDIYEVIPPSVKTVLSLGCGQGKMEVALVERGYQVTAVPVDPVISAGVASKGVEVVSGDFEIARASLSGRKFDCVLLSNVLHLVPHPDLIMKSYCELLADDGIAITVAPNVSRLSLYRDRNRGKFTLMELSDYKKTGVQMASPRIIRSWYRKSGMKLEQMIDHLSPRAEKAGRLTFGVTDKLLAKEFVTIGKKVQRLEFLLNRNGQTAEKQRSFSNALKWAYTGNWGDKVLSSVFVFILAGILGPRDFGVAAIAITYVAFLQIFLDQGVAAALIQRQELEHEHLDAVFWMDVVLSFGLVLVSLLFGKWWAVRNHAPEVARLIPVLTLTIAIEALSVVQTAILKRDLDFKSLAIRTNIAALIGGLGGVAMALGGAGVWALVGQQIIKDVVAVLLLWNLSSWRPRFEFSWKHLKELLGFSIPNFYAHIGVFADIHAASILLGLLFGPLAVGLYRIAERFVNGVIAMAVSSIQAVSFPEFSRLQDKPEELRKSVLTCIRLSSAATLPALAGLAAAGDPLMATLGPNWSSATAVLKILALLGMAVIFAQFTGPLLLALAKTQLRAILEWGRTIAGLATLVIAGVLVGKDALNVQIMGIALARFLSGTLIVMPVFLYILMRFSGVSSRSLFAAITPAAISAASVFGAIRVFNSIAWVAAEKPMVTLVLDMIIAGAVGLVMLLALDFQIRHALKNILRRTQNLSMGVRGEIFGTQPQPRGDKE
jgi:O-antigen/teichoic acid export membrane protein/2-polyprenyl-3-methyl-5-hydroxy-6-metoxy-1,4-benzoquinol methylase